MWKIPSVLMNLADTTYLGDCDPCGDLITNIFVCSSWILECEVPSPSFWFKRDSNSNVSLMFRMVPFSIPRNNLFLFSLFSSKEVDRFVLVGIILLGLIILKKNRKIRYFSVKPWHCRSDVSFWSRCESSRGCPPTLRLVSVGTSSISSRTFESDRNTRDTVDGSLSVQI